MTEIDDIKKLSPIERIERLHELENRRKRELEEAEKLRKEAEDDLKKISEIDVPNTDEKDITELFDHNENNLEDTIDNIQVPEEVKGVVYRVPIEIENEISSIYNKLNELSYNGNWGDDEFHDFYGATERLNEINEQFEEKQKKGYTLSEEVTNQLVSSQSVEYNIRKYREFGK